MPADRTGRLQPGQRTFVACASAVPSGAVARVVVIDMDYVRDEHRVHLVAYHLVWCPKRRKRVLGGAVGRDCGMVIGEVCPERGWEIARFAIQPDHVHLFVRASPSVAAHEVVRACKGRSSRVLRDRHRELLRLPSLWTRSYFCSTVRNVSQATVDSYVAAQIGR